MLSRGGHGFGKPAPRGVRGGEGTEHAGLLAAGELIGPLGPFHRFSAVLQRRVGAGRPQPGQTALSHGVLGLDLQGPAIMVQRLAELAPTRQHITGTGVSGGEVRFDLQAR